MAFMVSTDNNEIVYFLYSHLHVKIGKVTPKDQDINAEANEEAVLNRLKSCQTGNPNKIYLLGYMFGSESQWHKHFREHRGKGEWFRFNDDVRNTIEKLPLRLSQSYNIDTIIEMGTFPERVREYEENKERFNDYLWEYDPNDYFYENKEEDIEFAWKNRLEMSTFLTRMFARGYMHLAEKRKNRIKDWFGDIIEVGDNYFSASSPLGANGISIRNAVTLYRNAKKYLELMEVINARQQQPIS